MTQQELIKAFAAEGVQVQGTAHDSCAKLPDGTYGPIVTRYGVRAVIRDERHGNTVVRDIDESDVVDVATVVKEMRAEIAKRAKETKARNRSWRSVNRS